jgi:hypothetical protein
MHCHQCLATQLHHHRVEHQQLVSQAAAADQQVALRGQQRTTLGWRCPAAGWSALPELVLLLLLGVALPLAVLVLLHGRGGSKITCVAATHSSAAGAAASAEEEEEEASALLLNGKVPERQQQQQQVSLALQLSASCLLLHLCFSCWVWWVLQQLQLVMVAALVVGSS